MDDKTSRFSVVSNGIKCFLSAAELLCIQNMWGRTGDFTSESCSLKHFIHRESLWQRENFSSSLYAFCHPPEYWWAYRVVHSGDSEKNLECSEWEINVQCSFQNLKGFNMLHLHLAPVSHYATNGIVTYRCIKDGSSCCGRIHLFLNVIKKLLDEYFHWFHFGALKPKVTGGL